jgi:tetratricopeptide (TPR) repeat protein
VLGMPTRQVPKPPDAGPRKLADPRQVRRGWLLTAGVLMVVLAVGWPRGLGSSVDQLRRQLVAAGYLSAAERLADSRPAQRQGALAALRRAVALAPRDPLIADRASQLYVNLRAYREAIPWLQQQPRHSLLGSVSLGQCLLLAGQRRAGLALLSQALTESHRLRRTGQISAGVYALVLNNVGYVYALAGENLTEGRSLLAAALSLEPLQPAFMDSLGWLEYRLGNYAEAAFQLERAVRLALPEGSAEMYYHLGSAQARLGRRMEARRSLQRCLDLDPSWQEARHELDDLHQVLPPPAVAGRQAPQHRVRS